MSTFSSILDISSFFIGVLVNLLLVAMICFYFKRKIDNLELSQSEQAKMLFQIIQDKNNVVNESPNVNSVPSYPILGGLDLSQLNPENFNSNAEDGNDEITNSDDSDSDDSDDEENEVSVEQVKTIEYEDNVSTDQHENESNDEELSKLTVKELKTILENKGYSTRYMKKQDLIDFILMNTDKENPIQSFVKVEEVEEQTEIIDVNDNGLSHDNEVEVELTNNEIVDEE